MSSSNDVGQLLVNLLTSKKKNSSPSPSDGSHSSNSDAETTTMLDYLNFIKIQPSKHAEVLEILEKNDITSFNYAVQIQKYHTGSHESVGTQQWNHRKVKR